LGILLFEVDSGKEKFRGLRESSRKIRIASQIDRQKACKNEEPTEKNVVRSVDDSDRGIQKEENRKETKNVVGGTSLPKILLI
jgi:hypothetical protein